MLSSSDPVASTARAGSEAPLSSNILIRRRDFRRVLPFHFIGWLVLFEDMIVIVATSVATGAGYHFFFLDALGNADRYLGIGVVAAANFSAISAARGSYRPVNLLSFRRQVRDVTLIWALVCLILLSAAFALKIADTFSRGSAISFFAIGWMVIIAWRRLAGRFLATALAEGAFARRNIVVIRVEGLKSPSRSLMDLERFGYNPVKTFEIRKSEAEALGVPVSLRSMLADVINLSRQEPIHDIFLQIEWQNSRLIDHVLNILRVVPLPIHLVPDENVSRFLSSPVLHVDKAWTAELKRAPLLIYEQILKRGFDLAAAMAGVIVLSPLMLITMLMIKMESAGPVLFTQTRNGFNGRSFRIFKFRTMHVLEDGHQIRQATRDDPRVTAVGRFLRRTSIDELPQLFNVIGGSMSLVGPRPHAAAHNTEYEKIVANYAFRYHMKPGITGWAQVNGFRGETASLDLMERRVELDLWYVNNWSFWLDIRIIFRTVMHGLWRHSAY